MRMNLRAITLALGTAFILVGCGTDDVQSLNPTPPSQSAGFKQVVAFGDSLSDAGTYNPTTGDTDPSNDSATGLMFTTKPGGTWATYVASDLGLPLGPRQQVNFGIVNNNGKIIQLDGTDYAEGGARVEVDDGTNGVSNVTIPGLGTVPVQQATARSIKLQIDAYLADHGNSFNDTQLVLVQGGANDFFYFFSTTPPANLQANAPAFIQATVTSIVTQIGRLKAAGAKHILYSNLPDLGLTPQFLAQGAQAAGLATQLTAAYNTAVKQQLDAMGVKVYDTAGLIQAVVATPANYGMTNVTSPVCNSYTASPPSLANLSALICSPTTLVGNPNQYLFADGVHPTARAHSFWGDAVAQMALAGQI